MDNCSKLVATYKGLFLRTNNNNVREMYEMGSYLYDSMYRHYDYCVEINDIRQQYRICQLIDQEVLGKIANSIVATKSNRLANDMLDLHKRFMALSSRRVLRNMAIYLEEGKKKKVWSKTMETMRCVFDYGDKFSVSDTLNLMRVSCQPGLGKSFFGNLLVANICGNDSNAKVLRITYSDDLTKITTNQTKAIMRTEEFSDIFPRFKGIKKIFKEDTNNSFVLFDCEDDTQYYSATRDGQASGKRADWLIIDDLLKGEIESNNVTLHAQLTQRFYTDWSSRAGDDKQKTLLLGTMWADTDLLNVMYDKALAKGNVVEDKNYKYTEYSSDNTSCFIRIPALDKDNKSTCPLRFSTKYLLDLKTNTTEYLFMAVYQQNPIAPDGLEFNASVLNYYDEKPTIEMSEGRYASLDPARKGKNYVSMPITYRIGKQYLIVDWMFKKKDMKELYDIIVDKIIEHRLNALVVENNTDTSLKYVLEQKLFEKGYKSCNIIEKYSLINKEKRISDNQSCIRNNIIFPKKGTYANGSDIGVAIDNVTFYSFSYPVKFDDAIDSLAMIAMQFIDNERNIPHVGTFSRGYL